MRHTLFAPQAAMCFLYPRIVAAAARAFPRQSALLLHSIDLTFRAFTMITSRFSMRLLCAGLLSALLMVPVASAQSDTGQNSTSTDLAASSSSDISVTPLRRAALAVQISNVRQAAVTINTQLTEGTLVNEQATVNIAPELQQQLAPLFMTSPEDGLVGADLLRTSLADHGVSPRRAKRLATAVQGLTQNGTVELDQLLSALEAYNDTVDSAPADFLTTPPQEFLVVREVLLSLVQAGSAK